MAADGQRTTARFYLAIGYLAFGAGVMAAWTSPAREYELDIYGATPTAFWIGIGLAVLFALLVAYNPGVSPGIRSAAVVLLGAGVLAVAGLPLLRSYHYFGAGDSLSHLGFARMLASDRLSPFGFLYPGIHSIAVFTSELLGVPLTRALQYTALLFTALFVAFVPLCVRAITDSRWALVTGTAAAALLLPINNVSVFLKPYPTGQAILLLPFAVYLGLRYVSIRDTGFPRAVSSSGVLLGLTSIAVVLLHPQQAGSLLLLFGAVVAVQFLYRWRRPGHPVSGQRPMYGQFAFLGLVFLLWAPRFDRFYGATSGLIQGLLGAEPVGNEVTARAGSLTVLGGSVPELFVKLFGVALVFCLVAGFVVLAGLFGRLDERPYRGATVRYLALGLGLVGCSFLAFFLASVSVLPFRYLGAAMVVVTVLAAVGLVDGIPVSVSWPSWRVMRAVAVLVLGGLLAAQALHFHSSPYIYQPSDQVTEPAMDGYEDAFEHRDPDVWFTGVRGGPRRYVDAAYGTTFTDRTPGGRVFEGKEASIPERVFGTNVSQFYGRDRYVPVTDRDLQREVTLYQGFRYPIGGFRSLETTPGIHRVRSNGDFRLFYVDERNE